MEQTMNMERNSANQRCFAAPLEDNKMMLTFAISLLFTAGATFALLVIIGMLAGNRAAIASALAGQGAFGAALADAGGTPPHRLARVKVGQVRRGLGQSLNPPHRVATRAGSLRAAA